MVENRFTSSRLLCMWEEHYEKSQRCCLLGVIGLCMGHHCKSLLQAQTKSLKRISGIHAVRVIKSSPRMRWVKNSRRQAEVFSQSKSGSEQAATSARTSCSSRSTSPPRAKQRVAGPAPVGAASALPLPLPSCAAPPSASSVKTEASSTGSSSLLVLLMKHPSQRCRSASRGGSSTTAGVDGMHST